MKFRCPNCQNIIETIRFCPDCGVELIVVNDYVLIKEDYLQIKEVHDSMDGFREKYPPVQKEVSENLNNPDFFVLLNMNPNKKNEILRNVDEAYEKVFNLKLSIKNIYKYQDKIDFLKSMDFIFGDVESKMNQVLKECDDTMNLLKYYKNMILSNQNNIPDKSKVIEIHKQLDEYDKSLNDIISSFTATFYNQDALEELRYNQTERENMKKQVLSSFDSLDVIKNNINSHLDNKDEMAYLSYYDLEFGNVHEKMDGVLKNIESTKAELNKMLDFIDSVDNQMHHENKKEDDMFKGRHLDL